MGESFLDTISKNNLKRTVVYIFDYGFVNSPTGTGVKFNIIGK